MKYKNAEKYIKRLKNEIERINGRHNDLRKWWYATRGLFWFDYKDVVEQKAVLSTEDARKFHVEDEVIVHGKIIKFERGDNGKYVVTFTLKTVRVNRFEAK
uniref:Uncharacterized protein n=1 Tax=viral metagenome TaxID=1070528 RepID=A0A6H1ZRI4_9ZZZZ